MFWVKDGESQQIIYVSPAYQKLWGRSPESLYAQPQSYLEGIHPEDIQRVRTAFNKKFLQGKVEIEYRLVQPQGAVRWIRDRAFPINNQEGQAYRYARITEDITERKQAEDQLKASLREKEVLLREVHHRVKNNLQVISSLLNLQSHQFPDTQVEEVLLNCRNRVNAMALVHEHLYQSQDLAQIRFADYIQNLATHLYSTYSLHPPKAITLRIQVADEIVVNLDTAITCGLILNELLTNALKHAFQTHRHGEIWITLEPGIGECLLLAIGNNGDSLPADFDLERTESMGMRLVKILVRQLKGKISLEREGMTIFRLEFIAPQLEQGSGRVGHP